MYSYKSKKLPKKTLQYAVTLPWTDVVAENEKSFQKIAQNLQVDGFRKGKAPVDVARKYVSQKTLIEESVRSLIPAAYDEILVKEKVVPIISPRIELTKAEPEKDWEVTITVVLKPEVKTTGYKEAIAKVNVTLKEKAKKEAHAHEHGLEHEHSEDDPMQAIFEALLKACKVEVSDVLIEDEVDRRVSQLLDDATRVGISLEQYLASKKITLEELKKQYAKSADEMYQLEFILQEIAIEEKLSPTEEELSAILASAKTDKEKQSARQNLGWYANMLAKQKVLAFLQGL